MSQSKSERILIRSFSLVCAAVLLILAGCIQPAPVTPVPVSAPEEVERPAPPNPEISRVLSRLADIRDELKQIRNSVEELQFESERDKHRRQDLYQDIDRRLLELERNQRVINSRLERVVVTGEVPDAGAVAPTPTSESPVTRVPVGESGGQQEPDESPADTAVPDSDDSPAAISSATVSLDEQDAYDNALGLLKQSRYHDFISAAEQFVTTWPTSQLVDDVWYWIAEARYVNREFENALNDFRTVVVHYPDSQRVPEALLKMGSIQYDIGAYSEAAEIFRDILVRFPAHNAAISAQTRLRRIEDTIQ